MLLNETQETMVWHFYNKELSKAKAGSIIRAEIDERVGIVIYYTTESRLASLKKLIIKKPRWDVIYKLLTRGRQL